MIELSAPEHAQRVSAVLGQIGEVSVIVHGGNPQVLCGGRLMGWRPLWREGVPWLQLYFDGFTEPVALGFFGGYYYRIEALSG